MIILSAMIIYSCTGTSPQYRSNSVALDAQMQEMLLTLNSGRNADFISNYVNPSYVTSMGGVDAVLLEFGNTRQQDLIKSLKLAKNISPIFNEENKSMTYVSETMTKPLVFKQVGGNWYLQGDWIR